MLVDGGSWAGEVFFNPLVQCALGDADVLRLGRPARHAIYAALPVAEFGLHGAVRHCAFLLNFLAAEE